MARRTPNKNVLSWALYDWANSAFATTVLAGFFPVFFKQYWSADSDPTLSTLRLGAANSVASAVMVLASPMLGAIADAGGKRRALLAFFTYLGCLSTFALSLVGKGDWYPAAILFVLGNFGFAGGCIFYDSLLMDVAAPEDRDRASALGYGLGYLGGGVLFALNVLMSQKPDWFGFAGPAEAVRASFVTVAVWWAAFSIPVLRLPSTSNASRPWGSAIVHGIGQLWATTRALPKLPMATLFLCSFWLYMDGIDTVIRMALDYGLSIGLKSSDLISALLITQFVGFPAAIVFGKFGSRWGAKRGIIFCIGVYCLAVLGAYRMSEAAHFYMLAVVIGLVQGGSQALSRSFFSRLIPPDRPAEFFGFFNMMGKFAAVLGPVLVGIVARMTGDTRTALLSVLVLFLAGGALLAFVDEEKGIRQALEWKSGE